MCSLFLMIIWLFNLDISMRQSLILDKTQIGSWMLYNEVDLKLLRSRFS